MSARTAETDFNTLHRAFRASLTASNGVSNGASTSARKPAAASRAAMRVVNFSACLPEQVAYEANGSGAFTVRALRLLDKLAADVTHRQFQEQLRHAFLRHTPLQSPVLDCAPAAEDRPLLQPVAAPAPKAKRRAKATAA